MTTWLDIIEEMIHLYIKILKAQKKEATERERQQVHKEVISFLQKYVVPFCHGLVVRMVRSGEIEKNWWASNVLGVCKKTQMVLTGTEEDCQHLRGKEFENCIGFHATLALDHFKYVLHSNPVGRWNLVITFPITKNPLPEKDLKIIVKHIMEQVRARSFEELMKTKPLPRELMNQYEALIHSADEIFDIITALNHGPYLALDNVYHVRRKLRNPKQAWYKYY